MIWWRRLWRKQQMEDQLDRELRFHLDQHAADLITQGLDPEEARRQARIALGGPEQVKESCRDVRGTRWLEDLWQDFRYTLRTLRQRPDFTAVALCTLALGTGATTVMFTVLNGVLLKPLSYPEPERLIRLYEHIPLYGDGTFSYLNFLDCQREARSFAGIAVWRNGNGILSEPGDGEFVLGKQISSQLFSVLGVPLRLGRSFLTEEDRPGSPPVIIISERLWQRRFGGNPGIIGKQVVFEGTGYTVVGVVSSDLLLFQNVDVFTPIGQNTNPQIQNREMRPGIRVAARLREGVKLEQAQAELATIGHQLASMYPRANAGRGIVAYPFQQAFVSEVRPTLWLLLAAVGLVLLIACVNLASLLLARAVSRDREIAMRAALGATRGRLIRQCLTESAVLSLAGGALGVVIAVVGTRPFLTLWPGSLPRAEEVHFDWRVLLFALGVSLLSGLLFGLAPALRAPARHLEQALRAGARTVTGSSRRLHSSFAISEIALAVVLLIAAGILGRTLLRLSFVNPGFNFRSVLVARVALAPSELLNPVRTRTAWRDAFDRARSVPGVQAASIADWVPMRGDDDEVGYWTSPVAPPSNRMPFLSMDVVSPDYLHVMGIPLHRGRFLSEQDRAGSDPVVVIDDVLAQRAFGDQDPIGKRLSIQFIGTARVVGIVGHVQHWSADIDPQAKIQEQVYIPFAQLPDAFLRLTSSVSLVLRTSVSPLTEVEAVRREIRGGTRDQALYDVHTMEQIMHDSLDRQRFLLLLFGIFAGLALALACIGIYGVLAYLTSQRIPEIAVRMALGASAGAVLWMIFKQSLGMVLIGAGLGVAGALAAARILERLVPGVQSTEPITFAVMISVLIVAALLASFIPARRASRVDPMSALRQE